MRTLLGLGEHENRSKPVEIVIWQRGRFFGDDERLATGSLNARGVSHNYSEGELRYHSPYQDL
ncbi:MAG: hypothetical protein GEU78_18990 [Actinobacteria bacterium]|nr:hypothetical protein [Actinomycetota bacterium]